MRKYWKVENTMHTPDSFRGMQVTASFFRFYFSFLQIVSSESFRASAILIIVEMRPSSRRSRSSIVRTGTPLSSERARIDSFRSFLIFLNSYNLLYINKRNMPTMVKINTMAEKIS